MDSTHENHPMIMDSSERRAWAILSASYSASQGQPDLQNDILKSTVALAQTPLAINISQRVKQTLANEVLMRVEHNVHPLKTGKGIDLTPEVVMKDIEKESKMLGQVANSSYETFTDDELQKTLTHIAFGLIARDYALKDVRPNETKGFIKYVVLGKRTGSEDVDEVFKRIAKMFQTENRDMLMQRVIARNSTEEEANKILGQLEELATMHSVSLHKFAPQIFDKKE